MLRVTYCILILLGSWTYSLHANAELSLGERRMMVALRQMGHELLLLVGDTSTRVLPVDQVDDRYRIRFAAPFAFDPEAVICVTYDHLIETGLAEQVLVEMEDVQSEAVVHSFIARRDLPGDALACGGREQPHAYHSLYVTIMDTLATEPLWQPTEAPTTTRSQLWWMLLLFGLLGGGFFFWRQRKTPTQPQTMQQIGTYQFDPARMTLQHAGVHTSLSGKETELLRLLQRDLNQTVDRDTLLREVWGDEGDYVGRTLDVFISRLRKKLAQDEQVRIVNIRGVGYKLIVNAD